MNDDVIAGLEMVDRLKDHKTLIHVLPFIPMGALRKRPQTVYDEVLSNPLQMELILRGIVQTNRILRSPMGREEACRGTTSPLSHLSRHALMWGSTTFTISKLERKLRRMGRGSRTSLADPIEIAS